MTAIFKKTSAKCETDSEQNYPFCSVILDVAELDAMFRW